nr:unnamed protein product [Callosobruchus analis]
MEEGVHAQVDRHSIIEHVNSFNPTISHYRREHAPYRQYLPSDINITLMYKDFKQKYPNTDFYYESYKKIVTNDLNISFANLGNEECWDCEEFEIHKKATRQSLADPKMTLFPRSMHFFGFFVYEYIVNSSEVALVNLTIKFFEPGHTFMAADSFHHQVELSLKRKKKVYDFDDFCEVVERANSERVDVIKMQITQFFSFTDYTSKYKLQKLDARIYLKDMVCIHFKRGNHFFSYKTEIENEFIDSKDIFMKKYVNGTLTKPQARNICRGVSLDRKNNLISKLKKHIPENRMKFWEDLPISEDV